MSEENDTQKPDSEAVAQQQACSPNAPARRNLWNKCHKCGRIVPYTDFESGKAINRMLTPESDVSYESWEILCRDHYKSSNDDSATTH